MCQGSRFPRGGAFPGCLFQVIDGLGYLQFMADPSGSYFSGVLRPEFLAGEAGMLALNGQSIPPSDTHKSAWLLAAAENRPCGRLDAAALSEFQRLISV